MEVVEDQDESEVKYGIGEWKLEVGDDSVDPNEGKSH